MHIRGEMFSSLRVQIYRTLHSVADPFTTKHVRQHVQYVPCKVYVRMAGDTHPILSQVA